MKKRELALTTLFYFKSTIYVLLPNRSNIELRQSSTCNLSALLHKHNIGNITHLHVRLIVFRFSVANQCNTKTKHNNVRAFSIAKSIKRQIKHYNRHT